MDESFDVPTLRSVIDPTAEKTIDPQIVQPAPQHEVWEHGRCSPLGKLAERVWSDEGQSLGWPYLIEAICREPSTAAAWAYYRFASFRTASSEDWPNFERDVDVTPETIALSPSADEFEIGCGGGEADGLCPIWVFRARYGVFLVTIEFSDGAGFGMTTDDFSALVEQFDAAIRSRLGAGFLARAARSLTMW